eukprot:1415001-Karenia_brevis.AAC.1
MEKLWTWFCPKVSMRSKICPDMEDSLPVNGCGRDSLAHRQPTAMSQRPPTLDQCKPMSTV